MEASRALAAVTAACARMASTPLSPLSVAERKRCSLSASISATRVAAAVAATAAILAARSASTARWLAAARSAAAASAARLRCALAAAVLCSMRIFSVARRERVPRHVRAT